MHIVQVAQVNWNWIDAASDVLSEGSNVRTVLLAHTTQSDNNNDARARERERRFHMDNKINK